MTTKAMLPAASRERRQQLTREIKRRASAARSEKVRAIKVKHAVECGRALSELREFLGHGEWTHWVEERCAVNRMTANRYMRLASRAELLTPCMTIREAYIAAGVVIPKPSGSKKAPRDLF